MEQEWEIVGGGGRQKKKRELTAAHGEGGEAVLEDLLEAQEFDDGEGHGRVEAQASLVGADGLAELDAVPTVHLRRYNPHQHPLHGQPGRPAPHRGDLFGPHPQYLTDLLFRSTCGKASCGLRQWPDWSNLRLADGTNTACQSDGTNTVHH